MAWRPFYVQQRTLVLIGLLHTHYIAENVSLVVSRFRHDRDQRLDPDLVGVAPRDRSATERGLKLTGNDPHTARKYSRAVSAR